MSTNNLNFRNFMEASLILVSVKDLFILARFGIRMLPEIISRVKKSTSKLYRKVFYSSEQKTPILIRPTGEDAPDTVSVPTCLPARPENGIKTGDEFVKNLDRAEVPEFVALRESSTNFPRPKFTTI